MATRVDHKFALTKWGWINTIFIAFVLVVAWKPVWTALGNLADALGGLFSGAGK